jgi:hypothetical protein
MKKRPPKAPEEALYPKKLSMIATAPAMDIMKLHIPMEAWNMKTFRSMRNKTY